MSAGQPIPSGAGTLVARAWINGVRAESLARLPKPVSALDLLEADSMAQPTAQGATGASPSRSAVLQQLARVLQSKSFIQSDKLSRFLRFVVEHVLDGNAGCLKEYLVGVEVYDRKPLYDPSQDSIVRTEARRLRSRLKEFYEAEGKHDPIYIYLRPGNYVPVFQTNEELIAAPGVVEREGFVLPKLTSLPKISSIVTVIFPFKDISESPLSQIYARGIPDELAYALMLRDGCKVVSLSWLNSETSHEVDLAAQMKRAGAHIAYEGSVRVEDSGKGSRLRITARIIDASGAQLWVKRIDSEGETVSSLAIEERIALSLSTGFDVVQTSRL